jgi:TonB family protein
MLNMYTDPQGYLFSGLPDSRPPWKEFVLSIGTQGLAIAFLLILGILRPQVLLMPLHDYHFVQLVNTPPPAPLKPAPIKQFDPPKPILAIKEPSPDALRLPAALPKPKVQEHEEVATPKVNIAANAMPDLPKPTIPRELVRTNVFSKGSSATPTMSRPPEKVQTGGFGDPNGVPARETNGRPVNIAQLGSFDLPSGPGYGNGTGGAKGARGVVASAGFGNGVAIGDGTGKSNNSRGTGVVRQSGFGDADTAALTSKPKAAAAVAQPKTTPAEILSKPVPLYTDEARKQRIEGEVLLEVVFEASGKIRVLRVVRGLGHGLDENAVKAAEEVKFKPALRDGVPADSTAYMHIIFQLA